MTLKKGLLVFYQQKIPDPKFSSQTKDKLVSSEVRMIVETIINEKIIYMVRSKSNIAKIVLAKNFTSSFSERCCKKS